MTERNSNTESGARRRRGRPPGARNYRTIVDEIAGETREVRTGGRRVRRTTLEIALLQLRKLALQAKPRARRLFLDMMDEYGSREPLRPPGYLVVREPLTRNEFDVALRELHAQQRERRRRERPEVEEVERDP